MLGYVFSIGEARGEKEREKAHEQMASPPPSLSHWTLFIWEARRFISVLFTWWDERLESSDLYNKAHVLLLDY
jgi:hypothetical protein